MNAYEIIFILIITVTLTVFSLHKILQNHTSKFALFIDKIWDEWFEEQRLSIIAFIIFLTISVIIGFIIK